MKRLAIGDVYKVTGRGFGWPDDELDFTFEICGEAFFDGERYAIGLKQTLGAATDCIVLFDSDGDGETCNGDFKWYARELSRAKPRLQRPDND